jgi:hypothetical protein
LYPLSFRLSLVRTVCGRFASSRGPNADQTRLPRFESRFVEATHPVLMTDVYSQSTYPCLPDAQQLPPNQPSCPTQLAPKFATSKYFDRCGASALQGDSADSPTHRQVAHFAVSQRSALVRTFSRTKCRSSSRVLDQTHCRICVPVKSRPTRISARTLECSNANIHGYTRRPR